MMMMGIKMMRRMMEESAGGLGAAATRFYAHRHRRLKCVYIYKLIMRVRAHSGNPSELKKPCSAGLQSILWALSLPLWATRQSRLLQGYLAISASSHALARAYSSVSVTF